MCSIGRLAPFVLILVCFLPSALLGEVSEVKRLNCGDIPLIGIPQIDYKNTVQIPGGARQNWGITQDANGLLYFGNSNGLITYDGVRWNFYRMPGSVLYEVRAQNDTLFYASDGVLGYVTSDSKGSLISGSFYDNYPEIHDSLRTLYSMTLHDSSVYFRDNRAVIRWDGSEMKSWSFPGSPQKVFSVNGQLYTFGPDSYLKFLNNDDEFESHPMAEQLRGENMFGLLSWKGDLLGVTRRRGLVIIRENELITIGSEVNTWLRENDIYQAIPLKDGGFAFGSLKGGLLIVNEELQPLLRMSTSEGLSDNMILGLFQDSEESIWIGTMRGITRIDWPAQISYFQEPRGITEPVLNVVSSDFGVYTGTAQSIFKLDENCESIESSGAVFKHLENTGFVNKLLPTPYGVFIYSVDGKFVSRGVSVRKLSDRQFRSGYFDENSEILYSADINTLYFHKLSQGNIREIGRMENLRITPSSIAADNDFIWLTSGDTTFYRIQKPDHLQNFTSSDVRNPGVTISRNPEIREYRLPSNLLSTRVDILNYNGDLLFANNSNLFEYIADSDTFIVRQLFDPEYQNGERQFYRFRVDHEKNIWMRANQQQFFARFDADSNEDSGFNYSFDSNPIAGLRNAAVSYIDVDDNHVWFAESQGIALLNRTISRDNLQPFQTIVREVIVSGDSTIYGGYPSDFITELPVLPYSANNIRFTYASLTYTSPGQVLYQTRLYPYDIDWSRQTSETFKDYTGLPEGNYTFQVKSVSIYGVESSVGTYSFRILPPWYRTWWALSIFGISIIGILFAGYNYRVNYLIGIERARHTIARDLHDDVSATLSSINFFTEAIKKRPDFEKNRELLDRISASAIDAQDKIQDIIWSVSPENDNWDTLFPKMRRYASDLLESAGIEYDIQMPKTLPGNEINMYLRKDLWLMFKEMVTNAVEHSNCKHVDIKVFLRTGYLYLTVRDDGDGFEEKLMQTRNGLKNIRQRAKNHKAQVELNSTQGEGTEWKLRIYVG